MFVNDNNVTYFDRFQQLKRWKKIICSKYKKFEKPKISFLLEKTLILSIIFSKYKNEDEKIFKEEE